MNKLNFLNVFLVILLILIVIGGFCVWLPKRAENARLEKELFDAKQKLQQLEEELDRINQDAERLKNGDPNAIEKVARDKYGYSREGEEIYQSEEVK